MAKYGVVVLTDGSIDEPLVETRTTLEGAKRAVKDDIELCYDHNKVTNLYLHEALEYVDNAGSTGFMVTLTINDSTEITWYIVEVR